MAKVTAIGGVFIKSQHAEQTKQWYAKHLGIPGDKEYGASFEWRKANNKEQKGYTAWSVFPHTSDYFGDTDSQYMINYRVDKLDELLQNLKRDGIKILGGPESFEYGKFAWIEDPDGRRVELWEPVDDYYSDMLEEAVKCE